MLVFTEYIKLMLTILHLCHALLCIIQTLYYTNIMYTPHFCFVIHIVVNVCKKNSFVVCSEKMDEKFSVFVVMWPEVERPE